MPFNTLDSIPIAVTRLRIREGARPVNREHVTALAQSIKVLGQLSPILVQRVGDPSEELYDVVAGHHRVRAMTDELGAEAVRCIILDDDQMRAELAAIDENLLRFELSPAQKAKALARSQELYEALYPETRGGVAGALARHGSASDSVSFAAEAAQKTKTSPRTIQRALRIGKALSGATLDKVVGTTLDTDGELDALARLPDDARDALVRRASGGEPVSAREARVRMKIGAAETGAEVDPGRESEVASGDWERASARQEPASEAIGPVEAGGGSLGTAAVEADAADVTDALFGSGGEELGPEGVATAIKREPATQSVLDALPLRLRESCLRFLEDALTRANDDEKPIYAASLALARANSFDEQFVVACLENAGRHLANSLLTAERRKTASA